MIKHPYQKTPKSVKIEHNHEELLSISKIDDGQEIAGPRFKIVLEAR